MLTGKQAIDGKEYAFDDNGALQPTIKNQPDNLKPAKPQSDGIPDQLKTYVHAEVKAELSKLEIKLKE